MIAIKIVRAPELVEENDHNVAVLCLRVIRQGPMLMGSIYMLA